MAMLFIGMPIASASLVPRGFLIQCYVDKPQYRPGEEGILYIALLNYRDEAIEVRNITIRYSWFNYVNGKWEGNVTIIPADAEKALSSNGGKLEKQATFTVPNDGRVSPYYGSLGAYITVYTDRGVYPTTPPHEVFVPITVANLPPETLVDMDKLITLFTVQIVLIVICTLILAAAIFLSTRKPAMPPQKET